MEDASQAADDTQAEKPGENIAQGRQAKVEIPFSAGAETVGHQLHPQSCLHGAHLALTACLRPAVNPPLLVCRH